MVAPVAIQSKEIVGNHKKEPLGLLHLFYSADIVTCRYGHYSYAKYKLDLPSTNFLLKMNFSKLRIGSFDDRWRKTCRPGRDTSF